MTDTFKKAVARTEEFTQTKGIGFSGSGPSGEFTKSRDREAVKDGMLIAVITGLFLLLTWKDLPSLFPGRMLKQEPIGRIHVVGQASRRPPGEADWQAVKGDGPVYLKDFVYTTEDEGAEIYLDQEPTPVKLAPNTLVQIYDGGKTAPEILLLQGSMENQGNVRLLHPVPRPTSEKLTIDSADLALKHARPQLTVNLPWLPDPPSEEQTAIDAQWKQFKLNTVELGSTRQVAGAHWVDDLDDYELHLITPPKSATLNNEWILLSWSPVPLTGTVFEVDVSRTTDFKRVMTYSTEKNRASIRFVGQGLFYWRVRASWQSQNIESPIWTLNLATQ